MKNRLLTLCLTPIFSFATPLKQAVLTLALHAYQCAAKQHLVQNPLLTIVDYSIPSYKKRLWIINPKNKRILFHLLVAQGINSGVTVATRFSNKTGSLESSLGTFLTGHTFYGNDGYSLRLRGLQPNLNNNVFKRDVVMHAAWYVGPKFISQYDRIGRSWGCLALNPKDTKRVIDTIKDGSIIFSYAKGHHAQLALPNCRLSVEVHKQMRQ